MENLDMRIGAAVRKARERLGWTQADLAGKADFGSGQIVSQIEKGERPLKAAELALLSRILLCDLAALLTNQPLPEPAVLWRKEPPRRKEVEARFLQDCQHYQLLESLCGVQPRSRFPEPPNSLPASLEEAQQFGQVIRDFLGLGKRPADILRRVLEEDYAVKLFHAPGLAGSAASTVGSVGRAVLLNSSEPPWRRNFSLAHELFHLLTWSLVPLERLQSDAALKQRIEKLGENFASGLVLPSEEVSAAWDAKAQNGKTRYTDVIEIARVFGVSTEALIWRMVNLGRIVKKEADRVLADERFRSQDKATMAGIWGVDPPPIPERFVALGFRAWQEGELSRGRLAEFLHTNLGELGKVLAGYGLNENEDYEATLPPGRRQHRHQSPRT